MNLRKCDSYTVGLDIGTASVGWVAINEDGNLLTFKGKKTWGTRLFDGAATAKATRVNRTLRRRYHRRRQRILDLRKMLEADIADIDTDFYIRLDQSFLWPDDRNFSDKSVLFNDSSYSEYDYYDQFPTIYHLRKFLVESTDKADIRLVYFALHHIMKYRGHFLQSGEITAKDAKTEDVIKEFLETFAQYCIGQDIDFDKRNVDIDAFAKTITSPDLKRAEKKDELVKCLSLTADYKKLSKALVDAALGYETQFANIFLIEQNSDSKFSLNKEEKVEKFTNDILPEDGVSLFTCLQSLHNAYLLAGILKGAEGGTISSAFISRYERHQKELRQLKNLVKKYSSSKYDLVFRGETYSDGTYKKKGSKGYTAYILGKCAHSDFYGFLEKEIFTGVSFEKTDENIWQGIQVAIKEETYLRKLRTSDNGAIPHQLHLEELRSIVSNQKNYYSTLNENADKIESLHTFRIPYYVGPLGKNKNPNRDKPFSWMVRNEGYEHEKIKPWNFEKVVNIDETAERFITNLTGECTYYLGKKVIPKNSLLYSEFCVRQELNVCRVARDGENFVRFDSEIADSIFEKLFRTKKKVKVKDLENFLHSELGFINRKVRGTQKEEEFASSLSSHVDFERILGRAIEHSADIEMVETIIAWVTIFEDRKILKRKLNQAYGINSSNPQLNDDQIKNICRLRYTGWSNLSREFLEELRCDFEGGRLSIMGVLRNSRKVQPMNLMEILADERFSFQELLERKNEEFLRESTGYQLNSIPGSPAIKRGINQSIKIIEEITKIAGKPPKKICVEMAREEIGKGKGSRTKARLKDLEQRYKEAQNVNPLEADLKECKYELTEKADELGSEKTFLYLMQLGKCMYCGKPLNIDELSSYQVDHIVPQSFIKDDSLDNKVLVHASCNQTKANAYPLPSDMQKQRMARWNALREAGLLSAKKFEKLTARDIGDRQIKRFINRQLVETRQISKHVVELLQAIYPETKIESLKAELSHDLRVQYGFTKSRIVNDYHHAHDAYLVCQISRFVSIRYPKIYKDFDYSQFTKFTNTARKEGFSTKGFIVGSFGYSGFDKETGEITRDIWDAEAELRRIRECLNYKDCFVSKKLERLTGQFWNETVYSRRESPGSPIPLKKGLDPEKYGYYQSPNSAYYSLISHVEEVRGRRKTELVGIPVNESYRIRSKDDLFEYLSTRFQEVEVLVPEIAKYQKIEWDGGQYYLSSHNEMINARQLWLPKRYLDFIAECERGRFVDEEVANALAIELLEYLCEQIKLHYPRYSNICSKLSDEKTLDLFFKMSIGDKAKALVKLIEVLHANASRGLKEFGLSDAMGRMMNLNIGGSINQVTFYHSSVTGMFGKSFKI